MTQEEIADKVDSTPKSMSTWVNKGNWKVLKSSFTITREQELRRLYIQISEINNMIEEREQGKRFASGKEADNLAKIAAAIRSLETNVSIAEIVDTFIEFTNWLKQHDFEKAKEINDFMDSFIKYKLSKH